MILNINSSKLIHKTTHSKNPTFHTNFCGGVQLKRILLNQANVVSNIWLEDGFDQQTGIRDVVLILRENKSGGVDGVFHEFTIWGKRWKVCELNYGCQMLYKNKILIPKTNVFYLQSNPLFSIPCLFLVVSLLS